MKLLRFPQKNDALTGNLFGQTATFSYNGRELLLLGLFQVEDQQTYNLRSMERAWEAATSAAFTYRDIGGEDLIEKILTAVNGVIKNSISPMDGAIVLIEDNAINFSTNGSVSVVLTEGGSVTIVSSDQKTSEFTAVTSGQIETNDNIILAAEPVCQQLITIQDFSVHQLEEIAENEKSLVIALIRDKKVIEDELIEEAQLPVLISSLKLAMAGFVERLKNGISHAKESLKKKQQQAPPIVLSEAEPTKITKEIKSDLLPKVNFKLKLRPITIIGLIIFLSGLVYGSSLIYGHFRQTEEPEVIVSSLLTDFKALPAQDSEKYLIEKFSKSKYDQLNEEEKKEFSDLLEKRGITEVRLELIKEFPETLIDIAEVDSKIYGLDKTGQLWVMGEETLEKVAQKGLIIDPQRLFVFNANRLLVTDALGNIWLFDNSAKQPVSLPLPRTISDGKKILGKFQSNLYIYHQGSNLIYRVPGFGRDIINQSIYSDLDNIGLTTLQDYIIVGDAVGLDNTGKMTVFSRNTPSKNSKKVGVSTNARIYGNEEKYYQLRDYLIYQYNPALDVQSKYLILSEGAPIAVHLNDGEFSLIASGKNLYRVAN